jgi:hypothetical protein
MGLRGDRALRAKPARAELSKIQTVENLKPSLQISDKSSWNLPTNLHPRGALMKLRKSLPFVLSLAAVLSLGTVQAASAEEGGEESSVKSRLMKAGADFNESAAKSLEQFKTNVRESTGQEEVGAEARRADGASPSPKPARKSKRPKAK